MSDSTHTQSSPCRACGSAEVFGPVRLYPETGMGGGDVLVSTMASRPLGKPRTTAITAWACRRCGHLDLFAAEPEVLFEHWSAENR